jgi:hypothetical protein
MRFVAVVEMTMRASRAARLGASAERFVHNFADRARASPALSAASQATVDLTGSSRKILRAGDSSADIVVGQNVTGTDDH